MRTFLIAVVGALCLLRPAAAAQPNPTETLYTPITPCRAFDFALGGNHVASIGIAGTRSLETLGGPKTGCGIPYWATSVAITLRVSKAAAAGYLAAWGASSERPKIGSVFYAANATVSADPNVALVGGGLSLYSSKAVQVVGEVAGYYAPQIQALVRDDGASVTIESGPGRIVSATRIATGQYRLDVDRDVAGCGVQVTLIKGGYFAFVTSATGSSIRVNTWFPAEGGGVVQRNSDFYVRVHC